MREPTNCAGISQRVVDCSSCSSINTATNLAMEDGADQNDSDCVIQSDAESDSDSEDREFGTPPKEKRPRAMCGAAVYGTVTGNPISHLYHVGSMIKLIVFIAKYATRM